MPFMNDLLKFFTTEGPVHWEVARQLALMAATGGQPEANVDPLQRMRLDELVRVADLHVADATGLPTAVRSGVLTARPVTRAEWAQRALDDWRPLLEGLATSLGRSAAADGPDAGDAADAGDPITGLLGSMGTVIGPMLMSLQIGGLAGHLAQRALDGYDPPLPRPPGNELLVVTSTVDQFAADWSLPPDDVRLGVLVHEVTFHAVLGRPHVHARLSSLLQEYAGGFQPDPGALEDKLGGIDPSRPDSFQQVLGDPAALLGAVQTPEQRALLPRIEALTAAMVGYVDHVADNVGGKLIGSYRSMVEALRRRRAEESDASRFLGQLLGMELGQAQYDRGAAFVRGVVDRAGEEGLGRLWASETELPTPAEVDAPGLWLARIDL
jgi:putative hydrolase